MGRRLAAEVRGKHQRFAKEHGLVLEQRLGGGASREVYSIEGRPEHVAKVALFQKARHNRTEWAIWTQHAEEPLRSMLLPAIEILGENGEILLMPRGHPISQRSLVPPNAKQWLSDVTPDNWVRWNGRILCCDYSENRLSKNLGLQWREM